MLATKPIDNGESILDSRDIIARIAFLEDTEDGQEKAELSALQSLASDGEGSPDWQWGEALIRESYFEQYARELSDDVGAVPKDAKWPLTCIDWEQAASELKADYMELDFDGVVYLIRA